MATGKRATAMMIRARRIQDPIHPIHLCPPENRNTAGRDGVTGYGEARRGRRGWCQTRGQKDNVMGGRRGCYEHRKRSRHPAVRCKLSRGPTLAAYRGVGVDVASRSEGTKAESIADSQ